jgi:hypothetical protein
LFPGEVLRTINKTHFQTWSSACQTSHFRITANRVCKPPAPG